MAFPLSEYSFADSYLFRAVHHYELLRGKNLYLRGTMRQSPHRYLMPLQPLGEIDPHELIPLLAKEADFLFPIPKRWLPLFASEYFTATHDDGDSDYVYTVEKMRHYPGRHLSGKRNLVKQFLEKYAPTSYPLTVERVADAVVVLESWRSTVESHDETDYSSCLQSLELWEKLMGLQGVIYYVEGRPVGLLIGEPLTARVYVIRFLKALKEYKGLYQYIYQDFARELGGDFFFLNLEQDLGIPALAQAKSSYVPDCRCQKLRIALSSQLLEQISKGLAIPEIEWPKIPSIHTEECAPC